MKIKIRMNNFEKRAAGLSPGDALFYDRADGTLVNHSTDSFDFLDRRRYFPAGMLLSVSSDGKCLKVVSPERLELVFDAKNPAVGDETARKAYKAALKDPRFSLIPDAKYYVPTETDLKSVSDLVPESSLASAFSVFRSAEQCRSDYVSELLYGILGCFGGGKLRLVLGGLAPAYAARADEVLQNARRKYEDAKYEVGWSAESGEPFEEYLKRRENANNAKFSDRIMTVSKDDVRKPLKYPDCRMVKTYAEVKNMCGGKLDLLEFQTYFFCALSVDGAVSPAK